MRRPHKDIAKKLARLRKKEILPQEHETLKGTASFFAKIESEKRMT